MAENVNSEPNKMIPMILVTVVLAKILFTLLTIHEYILKLLYQRLPFAMYFNSSLIGSLFILTMKMPER